MTQAAQSLRSCRSVFAVAALLMLCWSGSAVSQDSRPIYRCDNNHYTNTLQDPRAQGCKLVEGGNITVVQGTRPAAPASSPVRVAAATQVAPGASGSGPRVDAADQRARDSDARQILESELKRAETRRGELLKEYNNGEPDMQGGEARNHQKYLDRVADLKAAIARVDSDIAGIRRELGRVSAAK